MRKALTITELDTESAELLPARETLYFNNSWANIAATNSSMAVNASTLWSQANSMAVQTVTNSQG